MMEGGIAIALSKVDAFTQLPELRTNSQYTQEVVSQAAHNRIPTDQRQPGRSAPPLYHGGSVYTPLRPPQPQAFRKCRPRAEPRSSPLHICAARTKSRPAPELHNTSGMDYCPYATWRAQCESARRRACPRRETALRGCNEPNTV